MVDLLLLMSNIEITSKARFDKQYSWNALLSKHFDGQVCSSSVEAGLEIRVDMETLYRMMSESHEYGKLRERNKSRVVNLKKNSLV